MRRIRRAYAARGVRPASKTALTKDPLEAMLATCTDGLIGLRDRALLSFAFSSGGRRRSEVAVAVRENLVKVDERTYVYRLTPPSDTGKFLRRNGDRREVASMNKHQVTDAQYAQALAAGQAEAEAEFRAQAVRYVPEWDAIEIVTTRNTGFLIPRQWIGALQESSAKDLKKLEVWPDGSAIEIEQRDIHISVHG